RDQGRLDHGLPAQAARGSRRHRRDAGSAPGRSGVETETADLSLRAGRLMLSVVCWKWKPSNGYRSAFGPETVNVLRAMVRRHYQKPHRFICVTDDSRGIDPGIEIIPLWDDYAAVPSP